MSPPIRLLASEAGAYRTVRDYMRRRLEDAGYMEVNTPQLVDRAFGKIAVTGKSPGKHVVSEAEDKIRHQADELSRRVQIFKQGQKSYRSAPAHVGI